MPSAGRTVLEVLQDFKSAQPPLEWLLQTAPHLKPRQFSIASSLAKHPNSAHVLMAVVDYKTPFKRRKLGLCSSWLASLAPLRTSASDPAGTKQHANGGHSHSPAPASLIDVQGRANVVGSAVPLDPNGDAAGGVDTTKGAEQAGVVPMWVEKGVLQLPASHSTPMILVGPGTGVAPFKSFLEERQMAAAGRQLMGFCLLPFFCINLMLPCLLFTCWCFSTGCRHTMC